MRDVDAAWKYADAVEEERRRSLAAPASYEELFRLVVDDAQGIRVRAEPGRDQGLTHCIRAVVDFELPTTGDALFNGPRGYRAQYWKSPSDGLAANALLLSASAPRLLGAVDLARDPRLTSFDVCTSVHAASAKLWIQDMPSWLAQPTEDLDVERWLDAARRAVDMARWGVCALPVVKFQIEHALLDPYGSEVVPFRKIRRHYDIHHYGFS